MFKSIFFVLLVGTVYVNGMDLGTFIWDNILEPAIDSIIENTTNLLTGWVSGLFGKRGFSLWGFVVDNIIEPAVESIIDNTTELLTGWVSGLFGKRGFSVWGFVVDNIIEPAVESIIDNTTELLTGWISGLFSGKRALSNLFQTLKPIVANLFQATVQSLLNFVLTLKPLIAQVVFHKPGHSVRVGIVNALSLVDEEMKAITAQFVNSLLQAVSSILSTIQINQLVNYVSSFLNVLLNLTQYIEPIVNALFGLLNKPFVSQIVGALLG